MQEQKESDLIASVKAAPVGGGSTIETPATITKATKPQVKPIAVDIKNLNQSLKNLETKVHFLISKLVTREFFFNTIYKINLI